MIHTKFTKNSQAAPRVINWNIKWLKNPNAHKMSKSLKTINKTNSSKRSPNSAAKSSQDRIFTSSRSQNPWTKSTPCEGQDMSARQPTLIRQLPDARGHTIRLLWQRTPRLYLYCTYTAQSLHTCEQSHTCVVSCLSVRLVLNKHTPRSLKRV